MRTNTATLIATSAGTRRTRGVVWCSSTANARSSSSCACGRSSFTGGSLTRRSGPGGGPRPVRGAVDVHDPLHVVLGLAVVGDRAVHDRARAGVVGGDRQPHVVERRELRR